MNEEDEFNSLILMSLRCRLLKQPEVPDWGESARVAFSSPGRLPPQPG